MLSDVYGAMKPIILEAGVVLIPLLVALLASYLRRLAGIQGQILGTQQESLEAQHDNRAVRRVGGVVMVSIQELAEEVGPEILDAMADGVISADERSRIYGLIREKVLARLTPEDQDRARRSLAIQNGDLERYVIRVAMAVAEGQRSGRSTVRGLPAPSTPPGPDLAAPPAPDPDPNSTR